ncbi:MAG: PilZ domain-containing protein [Myxococcales bacterium]|nr:PilZ domain-containing protein [Myxococcales bacterium]
MDLVDPEKYPMLAALCAADASGTLLTELERFRSARTPRHPRRPAHVVARLEVGELQRSVVLWDISRSGVSLVLPQDAVVLRPEYLSELRLLLRTATGVVNAKVSLVRIVSIQDGGMHVALRFEGLSDEEADRLDQLGTLLVSDLFRASADLLAEPAVEDLA